jgi:hypothetical protein
MNGFARNLAAIAALTLGAGTAAAQVGAGPAPGAVDASKAVSGSRETREDFNRAAANLNKPKAKASTKEDRAVAATAADLVAGSPLRDSKGEPIGTVESVDAEGAVVASGTTRIRVPLNSFGKNKDGLMLGITKADFDAAVAKATAKPQG